jgi:hypothetical protein
VEEMKISYNGKYGKRTEVSSVLNIQKVTSAQECELFTEVLVMHS